MGDDKKQLLQQQITEVQEQIRQLQNRQKVLLGRKADAERKARTHRLIENGAILESVFPLLAGYSGEEVKAFLLALAGLPEARKPLTKTPNPGGVG